MKEEKSNQPFSVFALKLSHRGQFSPLSISYKANILFPIYTSLFFQQTCFFTLQWFLIHLPLDFSYKIIWVLLTLTIKQNTVALQKIKQQTLIYKCHPNHIAILFGKITFAVVHFGMPLSWLQGIVLGRNHFDPETHQKDQGKSHISALLPGFCILCSGFYKSFVELYILT